MYIPVAAIKPPSYLEASHSINVNFAQADVGQPIPMDTNDLLGGGITHVAGDDFLTVTEDGAYDLTPQPHVTNGTGANDFWMWLEVDSGSSYQQIAHTGAELGLRANRGDSFSMNEIIPLVAGDKVRVMSMVSSTNIFLEAKTLPGMPDIPSFRLTVFKAS